MGSAKGGAETNKVSASNSPPAANSAGDKALTSASLLHIDYIAVPASLTPYVTTFYHFRCDENEIKEVQPASIGHLAIFPYGEGVMRFLGGVQDRSHQTNLLTPSTAACPFEVSGPFHAIGAVMSPLGWAALTGMDANKHTNRLLDAGKYLGEPLSRLGEKLCAAYRDGEMDGHACAMALAKYIENHLRPVNKRHAELIQLTTKWLGGSLDPPLESLFERTPYSKRQVQRLVERYFGMSPVALKRMYRGLRAAALLWLPTLTPEFEAMVYDAFYDQSHMIREIRLFAGRTPARLGDGESRFLSEMLDPKNFREIDFGSQDLI